MEDVVRSKVVRAERVEAFIRDNPVEDPGHQTTVTLFRGRHAVIGVRLDQFRDNQLIGRASRARRRSLRAVIEQVFLRHLAAVAALVAKTDPTGFGAFKRNTKASFVEFGVQARAQLERAKELAETLKQHGLGATELDELEKLVDEYDEVTRTISGAQARQVAATQELLRVGVEITEAVRVLDGVYRYRFINDPERLAQWINVRDVFNAKGKAKSPPPPLEGGGSR